MKRLIVLLLILIFASNLLAQYSYQKPLVGIKVNWSHSLSNNLVGAWIFNDYSTLPYNLINGIGSVFMDGTTLSLTKAGIAVDMDGGTDGLNMGSFPDSVRLINTEDWTILGHATSGGGGDAFSHAFGTGLFGAGSSNNDHFCIGEEGGNLKISTDGETPGNGSALTTDGIRIYHFAMTVDADGGTGNGRAEAFLDGKFDYGVNMSGTTWQNGTNIFVGVGSNEDEFNYDGHIINCFLYQRILSEKEIAELHRNPYQMIEQTTIIAKRLFPSEAPSARRIIFISKNKSLADSVFFEKIFELGEN